MTRNKYKNHWQQYQAHLWGLKPPHHTHLGNRFFEFEYINIIQDSFSLLLSCRNVTLRSHIPCRNVTLRFPNTTVSERDTMIQYYRVGTWHSDPFISLFYFIKSYLCQGITSIDRIREYKFYGLRISDQSQTTQPKSHNHTVKYIENFTISFKAYRSLFRVYLSYRNKP